MPLKRIATFSIVAYDKGENAWGIAVSSKFPAVGAVVPWARAGEGAVATQSYANTTYGPLGLGLMASGVPAQEALTKLVNDDEKKKLRQADLSMQAGTQPPLRVRIAWNGRVDWSVMDFAYKEISLLDLK